MMKAAAHAQSENKQPASASARSAETMGYVDSRPEAMAQRRIVDMMNSSPRMSQLRSYHAMVNDSSRVVAQRRHMESLVSGEPVQRQTGGEASPRGEPAIATAPNRTGLPDKLKTGVENLSGLAMDDVKVHYNSSKPAQLQALAYAQGTEIHIGPGQERHLAHEVWHVVQQKQGRVRPTMQMKDGVPVNDDAGLEREADVMGDRAASGTQLAVHQQDSNLPSPIQLLCNQDGKNNHANLSQIVQRAVHLDLEGTPNNADIIHIKKIDRIDTPDVDYIPGTQGANAARHIIPSALLQREFKSRYNGKSVATLRGSFPSVALDNNFLVNLSKAMWDAFLYENRQLNFGSNVGAVPEGATDQSVRRELPDLSRHSGSHDLFTVVNRNYWAGSQAGNLEKDSRATTLLANADNPTKKIKALAEEFDPPPFATQEEIRKMAEEWARLTNSWLASDLVSRAAYWPGRDLVAADAYAYGENKKIYNKNNKKNA